MAVSQAGMCWCSQTTCLLQFAGFAWHETASLPRCGSSECRTCAECFKAQATLCIFTGKDKNIRHIFAIIVTLAEHSSALNQTF